MPLKIAYRKEDEGDFLGLDYYPFACPASGGGSQMPGRQFNAGEYRYGFQGQEMDKEIYGTGNSYTAEFWQYDPRLGRRWNVDPVVKPWESSYAVFANNPIWFVDPFGADTSFESQKEKEDFDKMVNHINNKITDYTKERDDLQKQYNQAVNEGKKRKIKRLGKDLERKNAELKFYTDLKADIDDIINHKETIHIIASPSPDVLKGKFTFNPDKNRLEAHYKSGSIGSLVHESVVHFKQYLDHELAFAVDHKGKVYNLYYDIYDEHSAWWATFYFEPYLMFDLGFKDIESFLDGHPSYKNRPRAKLTMSNSDRERYKMHNQLLNKSGISPSYIYSGYQDDLKP